MICSHRYAVITLWLLLAPFLAHSADQSIEEKKNSLIYDDSDLDPAALKELKDTNQKLDFLRAKLQALYNQVQELFDAGALPGAFQALLQEVQETKKSMQALQSNWKDRSRESLKAESYSLWHMPSTTIGQLVMDYGAWDYVYIIPAKIAQMPISVDSHLAIPRASWNDLLEWILAQQGIGIRQVNPYLRQLYILKEDLSAIKAITSERADLNLYPNNSRLCFVLTINATDPARVIAALQRLTPNDRIQLQPLGKALFIFGFPLEIQDLLKVFDFLEKEALDQEYKMQTLNKIEGKEMELILHSYFAHAEKEAETPTHTSHFQALSFSSSPYALFMLGSNEQIKRAEEIIQEVQNQLQSPQEQVVFWYACRNSEAEELAKVLEKVYRLMLSGTIAPQPDLPQTAPINIQDKVIVEQQECSYPPTNIPSLIVNPPPVNPGGKVPVPKTESFGNFIVDSKGNALIMVVQQAFLPRLKELLQKLDRPKRMVQLEVLLFEKRMSDKTNFGLNLLRMGSAASGQDANGATWNYNSAAQKPFMDGVFSFLISRKAHGSSPNFDLIYNFLLTQEDIHVNASPSVMTVNQTPAKIAILEELSINTGAVLPCNNNFASLENSYARAQYGITIEITPTIHFPEESEGSEAIPYVTLNTELEFDTVKPSLNERPEVIRRNVKNQVRIADGETAIIGGLRRKLTQDMSEKIPFLGEIPGFGKLFSHTSLHDHQTEMFIFITPKIVADPDEEVKNMRIQELCRRPGDTPEFLRCLQEAQNLEKRRVFSGAMQMIFGRSVYGN